MPTFEGMASGSKGGFGGLGAWTGSPLTSWGVGAGMVTAAIPEVSSIVSKVMIERNT